MSEGYLSVVCPVFNEEKFINHIIDFFEQSRPETKELILIDGGSTDRSVEIIKRRQANNPSIKLLFNPEKYVPFALNKAISSARGNSIVRIDAHTEYAEDYFLKIIETFNKTGADIVGGPMRPIGKTSFQKAVAYATSTKFGIGGSNFHNSSFRGYVDSVYLGAWKKEIFNRIGMFDTRMIRNQDDEFHYRAKSKGYKIFLEPEIKSYYYPRENYKSLFSQYFQYGLYKPLVLNKISSEAKPRHLIPSFFIIYLLTLPLSFFSTWYLLPLVIYILGAFIYAIKCPGNIKGKILVASIYPVLHIAYGSGFILGLFKK